MCTKTNSSMLQSYTAPRAPKMAYHTIMKFSLVTISTDFELSHPPPRVRFILFVGFYEWRSVLVLHSSIVSGLSCPGK